MTNTEKKITDEILRVSGFGASKLGLRFDRVVVRVLGRLRTFSEAAIPERATVLVTISAPIRSSEKTADDLMREIGALVSAGTSQPDHSATVHNNSVRMRLVEHSSKLAPKLIGFVHNLDSAPKPLLDLAERWLRGQT